MPPTGLNAATLARMRANNNRLLVDTCTIQSVALASDGSGGKKRGWSNAATNVPCVIDGLTGEGQSSQGLNAKTAPLNITVPWNTTSFVAGVRILHGGNTYEVWEIIDDQNPIISRRGKLKRINGTP